MNSLSLSAISLLICSESGFLLFRGFFFAARRLDLDVAQSFCLGWPGIRHTCSANFNCGWKKTDCGVINQVRRLSLR